MTHDENENYFKKPVIAIGGSAGSLTEAMKIARHLPHDLDAAVFFACHRPYDKESNLKQILANVSDLSIDLVHDGDQVSLATIHISDPGHSLGMDSDGKMSSLYDYSFASRNRNIDEMFISLSKAADGNTIGVMLSGNLSDGSCGLEKIKSMGGKVLVQDPETAQYPSMPKAAIERVPDVDLIGSIDEITRAIIWYVSHPEQW